CSSGLLTPTRVLCSRRYRALAADGESATPSKEKFQARWRRRQAASSTRAARSPWTFAEPKCPCSSLCGSVRSTLPPATSRNSGLAGYIAWRLGQSAIVLLIMSFVIYGLIGLMPGDPIDVMAANMPGATPEVIARLKAIYGLDQPLLLRYWRWLMAALRG